MNLALADMRSARAWTDLASWIRALAAVATTFPGELKNKYSRKGEVQAEDSDGGGHVRAVPRYMNNTRIRTTLSARESALMGSGTCGNEALHAELRDVFRQVYNVSLPTFRVKLNVFSACETDIVRRCKAHPSTAPDEPGSRQGVVCSAQEIVALLE